jgi:hypothetical protein
MRFLALLLLLTSALSAQTITIAPAPADRAALTVEFKAPADAPKIGRATKKDGDTLPVQVDEDGRACLVVGFLRAGESLTLSLAANNGQSAEVVRTRPGSDGLSLSAEGKEVLNFRTDKDKVPRTDIPGTILRAGYLHPVRSPSGAIVTGDYPSNHAHHHGIWTPYTKAVFQGRTTDFWNMQNKKGEEQLRAVGRLWAGEVHGGFDAELRMTDLSGTAPIDALIDRWSVKAYAIKGSLKPMHVFDLTTTQACATNDPLELPQYHYGSFGLRGPESWDGKDGARFLTSEGISDRKKGDSTRARWCYLGGKTEAGISGTAVLGYPDNFRFPMPLRLHPDMPYFSIVPQKLGAFSIQPGKPYVTRYRFVVTDGEPDAKLFDACWNSLAHPAVVSVAK